MLQRGPFAVPENPCGTTSSSARLWFRLPAFIDRGKTDAQVTVAIYLCERYAQALLQVLGLVSVPCCIAPRRDITQRHAAEKRGTGERKGDCPE